ncbi:arginine--tRNA ligase [Prochlorococcus sp. MIT 1300]|uniref:arginine--tRNA ligase n=1 Tax=Prochlorococcus sp. MIT 1300 TaxID=3096218 RepID=UPI002A75FC01|nr:arginine--tRNA ligase [Prochlorococcus sp. MIT 1300]
MLTLSTTLGKQVKTALQQAFPQEIEEARIAGISLDPQLAPASKPEFGDFQINGALSLAKVIKKPPRQIAQAIVEELITEKNFLNICEHPEIAGPGFINLTLRPNYLAKEIQTRLKDKRLGVPEISKKRAQEEPQSVIIDFSSPNIAKEMHVGHLRSTIIGDSLARILEFRGHKVLRINHIGDWGTQFGMLITHLKDVAPTALNTPEAFDLGDLVTLYRESKIRFDSDKAFQAKSRDEVVKLQNGDPISIKAWQLLCDQSRKAFQNIYTILDIQLTERGESFYNPYLRGVIDDLQSCGMLTKDDGAKCVFLESATQKGHKKPPVIVQKRDGGFNYATTDLAAIRYRFGKPPKGDGARRIIYVTDSGQANHFESVFEIANRANWIPNGGELQHVPFGLVLGEDGKKLKTRSGDTVKLRDLLDESISRAERDLRCRLKDEKRKEDDSFIKHVSKTIGLAAVKYADLSQNRITSYQFNFDRMLSLQGNTAPYLLYAVVRIAGIIRKGGEWKISSDDISFEEPQELALIRQLLKFDEIIVEVEQDLLPNRLCNYLFELSQSFNRFYDQIPVIKAKDPTRQNRLSLCLITANTLKLGLSLLGIPTLERM